MGKKKKSKQMAAFNARLNQNNLQDGGMPTFCEIEHGGSQMAKDLLKKMRTDNIKHQENETIGLDLNPRPMPFNEHVPSESKLKYHVNRLVDDTKLVCENIDAFPKSQNWETRRYCRTIMRSFAKSRLPKTKASTEKG